MLMQQYLASYCKKKQGLRGQDEVPVTSFVFNFNACQFFEKI